MAIPQISRRDFLALAGLTSASAGCPAMAQAMNYLALTYAVSWERAPTSNN